MSWYCITLSPEQAEFGFAEIIRAEMEEIWLAGGALYDASLWIQKNPGTTSLYFSPVAAELGKMLIFRFGGEPCDEPDIENLTFLLGQAFRDDIS